MQRRRFIQGALAAGLGATAGLAPRRTEAASETPPLLFVVAASGGASIIDSFLPIVRSEVSSPDKAKELITYPEQLVAQPGKLRGIKNIDKKGVFTTGYDFEAFLQKHHRDMMVMTVENTSVNHSVAQERAVNGAGVDRGRTVMEAMAETHGANHPIPNVNLASGGYIAPGTHAGTPFWARAEMINSPQLFALGTDGTRGVEGAPDRDLLDRARAARQSLEEGSTFGRSHSESGLRERFLTLRRERQPAIERADLLTKLMLLEGGETLDSLGLERSPEAARLFEVFPNILVDNLHAQGAIAYLLARYGISVTVTMGPSGAPAFLEGGVIEGTPIAFDYSHVDHMAAQQVMWGRMCLLIDGLKTLLEETPYGEGSMWDQSLIYVATDFGRDKIRPPSAVSFSTGHHLNNGCLLMSPKLKGDRVFGGVDPETGLTYGCNLETGEPEPGALLREGHIYSTVCQALGVEFPGRHDMSFALR